MGSSLVCFAVDRYSNVTFADIDGLGTGERQWMSLHYTVNNVTGTSVRLVSCSTSTCSGIILFAAGEAYVHINGDKYRVGELNTRAGQHSTIPVSVILEKKNVITFSIDSEDDTFEAHLDGIEVLDGTEEEIEVKL
jgi:hypothetical protein